MSQKIAISELLENAGSINDDDLLLLSKKTSGNNFKSTKLAGSVFKEIVNGLISAKSSDFHKAVFPDWDDSKKTEITTVPYTISGNGWLVISYKNSSGNHSVGVRINDILVAGFFNSSGEWQDLQPNVIPVCDGDIITIDSESDGTISNLNMYFYPIKLVTEHGIIGNGGSGGVIDGTSFELVNGDSGDKHKKTYNSGKISDISYIVENDCLLYIHTLNNGEQIRYYINENEIYHGTPSYDIKNSCLVPVKSGSTITVGAGVDGTDDVTLDATNAIIFVEYKLNSIAPQIAMPDYSAPDDITSYLVNNSNNTPTENGYTATKNGWISVLYTAPDSSFDIEINGNIICNITTAFSIDMSLIPISKNDIVKAVSRPGSSVVYATFNFYPAKAVVQDANSVIELLYPVGSIYLDASGSDTCPLSALIPGSTWTQVGSKILTGGSTAPVAGNGTALGLIDGLNGYGLVHNSAIGISMQSSAYNQAAGTVIAIGTTTLQNNTVIGVTTDSTKSGLVADLSSATGLAINIWKRTA